MSSHVSSHVSSRHSHPRMVSELTLEGTPFLSLWPYTQCRGRTAMKDKQKGRSGMKIWARVHTPRLRARTPAPYALPLGAVQAGGTGMGLSGKKGDTRVGH